MSSSAPLVRWSLLVLLAATPIRSQTFTSTGLFTRVEDPADLALQNFQFTETVQPDGRVLVEVGADLRNNESGEWKEATVTLTAPESGLAFEVTDPTIGFGAITSDATVSPDPGDPSLAALVAAADVTAFKTALQIAEDLNVEGKELLVFSREPRPVDFDSSELWISGTTGLLVFSEETPFLQSLLSGQLLVEDRSLNPLPWPQIKDPFDSTPGGPPPVLMEFFPFEVTSIAQVNGEWHVSGSTRELLEVLKSGSFRQSADDQYPSARPYYDPPVENTYTEQEETERRGLAEQIAAENPTDPRLAFLRGLSATPIRFNDIAITPKLTLSGEVLLRSSGIGVELKIRNFELQRVALTTDAGIVLNAVIEVGEAEDNSTASEEEQSKEIAQVPLPPVTLSIAGAPIAFQPIFTVTVGAEVVTPTLLTIPLQSAVLVSMEAGWDRSLLPGDPFFYTPDREIIPLQVSDPAVFDEVAVTASAFAEAAFEVAVGTPPSPSAGGVTTGLGVRTRAEATVAPLSDPWWEMDFLLDLVGKFGINFLGINVLDETGILVTETIFHAESDGPLLAPQAAGPDPADLEPFKPVTGRRTRWARTFQTRTTSGGNEEGFAFFLPDTDDEVLVAAINPVSHSINKFDAEGKLLWTRNFAIGDRPKTGVPIPGGGFAIAGIRGLEVWVAAFDTHGNLLWSTSFEPGIFWETEKLLHAVNASGQSEFYLAGHVSSGGVRASDPAAVKFDAGGQILWSKYYAIDGDDEPRSLTQTGDGDIVLCGTTDADVEAPPEGTPNNDVIGFNATKNLLLMKVAAADGALQWAKVHVCRSGSSLNDVVAAPDGTLFACGEVRRQINLDYPVNLAAKFDADGTLIDHVLLGDSPDVPDDLPTGGNTPFDSARAIEWCEGHLYLAGTTGLGADRSGWFASLTEELGAQFYTFVDGPFQDTLIDLDCSEEGMIAVGETGSIAPWNIADRSTLLINLPYEGTTDFHEVSGLEMRYFQPHVFHSSGHPDFQVTSTVGGSPPLTFSNQTSEVAFECRALPTTPGVSVPDLSPAAVETLFELEAFNRSAVHDYAGWANYHQLPSDRSSPGDNPDNDPRDNGDEFFFGGNPFLPDPPVGIEPSGAEIGGVPHVQLEFTRSRFASALEPEFEASTDLTGFNPLDTFTLESFPFTDDLDLMRLSVPMTGFDRRFFKVVNPARAESP